ncbi:MAG TPA: AMP-binding protein [Zeimonas sp.]|nr:AMP-binding protein [Zeimonas sp.]
MTTDPAGDRVRGIEGLVLANVRALAAELHPQSLRIPTLGADDSLERDFGLDSLARAELGARLERASGARLPEQAFADAETPAELARWIGRVAGAPTSAVAGVAEPALGPQPRCPDLPADVSTLTGALDWHAQAHPARIHMLLYAEHEVPEPVSYERLRELALETAAGLISHCAVEPGDRVAIMLPTGLAFFAAFYGALYAGAVPVPLYPPARPSQLEEHLRRVAGIVANAGAKVLVTVREARAFSALVRPLAPSLRTIVEPDRLRGGAHGAAPVQAPGDVAFLQYTSGSTGQPKGVVLTHANLLANLRGMRQACGVASTDLFVSWLPLYHDMGLIGACLGAMVFGFTLVLMSPLAFLGRPSRWLWMVHRHRATITAGPNFAFELCVNKIRDDELRGLELSSLQFLFNGAEAVSPDTIARFAERFVRYGLRREAITPVYGLAECTLGLTFPPRGRGPRVDVVDRGALLEHGQAVPAPADTGAPVRLVSCGRVLAGHALRIVSPEGERLAERRQGEIEFRGPSATRGYHENPQATAKLFDGPWLRTGDLGYLADGELFITGRTKDIIIRGGHNIHPQELEEAASRVEGVRKGAVAVFPARDHAHGTERLVVLAETTVADPRQRDRIRTEIGRLAVDLIGLPVDEIVLAAPHSVLKTSSGKIRRAACRERYERGEADRPSRPAWRQALRLGVAGSGARVRRTIAQLAGRAWGLWVWAVFALLAPAVFLAVVSGPSLAARRRAAKFGTRVLFALGFASPRVTGSLAERPSRASAGGPGTRGHACLIVANHASYLDGLVLTAVLPPRIAFVAKRELQPQRFAGLLLRKLGALFVERFDMQRSTQDAQQVVERLALGEQVVVFAEGTFLREPGLLPLRMGAFVNAAAHRVPIVPVAILGTRTMLPGDDRFPRRARLEVIIGDPLTAEGDDWQAAVALRARVRGWLLARTGEPDLER